MSSPRRRRAPGAAPSQTAFAVAALAIAALAPVPADGRPPARAYPLALDEAALVAATRRGDPASLEGVARRLGPGRLVRALGSRDGAVVRAAHAAAPLLGAEAWPLLLALTAPAQLGSADRTLAAGAARAAAAIARQLDADALAWTDAPLDEIAAAASACARAARWPELGSEIRVDALECALALAAGLGARAPAAARSAAGDLLEAPATELRRAAVDLADARDGPTRARLAAIAARDPDPIVADAALAALCRDDPASARALVPGAEERLRVLARPRARHPDAAAIVRACAVPRRRRP